MSATTKIRLYPFRHRQQDVVVVSFEYDASLVTMIKQLPGACWSRTLKSWYFPKNIFDLHLFFETFKEVAYVDYSGLKQENRMKPIPTPGPVNAAYNLKAIKAQLSPDVKAQIQSFKNGWNKNDMLRTALKLTFINWRSFSGIMLPKIPKRSAMTILPISTQNLS